MDVIVDEGLAEANNTRLGYLRTGRGQRPVVFLHGWPQTSYAWRRVLPLLGDEYSAIAFDLRGIGRSAPARAGFDKATMAEDVLSALESLRVRRPVLVGHGVGAMVAYALARRRPGELAGLMLVDTPLPGLPGWAEAEASSAAWHLAFHRVSDQGDALAEALVRDREAVYFRSFIDRFAARPEAIADLDIAEYVRGYRGSGRLEAGFEMYRALPVDAADNHGQRDRLALPILAVLGEFSCGSLAYTIAEGLRAAGATDVRTAIIDECGHWPAEEQPAALAEIIGQFAGRVCDRAADFLGMTAEPTD